jgi:hypothetical protein
MLQRFTALNHVHPNLTQLIVRVRIVPFVDFEPGFDGTGICLRTDSVPQETTDRGSGRGGGHGEPHHVLVRQPRQLLYMLLCAHLHMKAHTAAHTQSIHIDVLYSRVQ